MFTSFKPYAILVAIAISFFAGVMVTNWHHDSMELVAEKAAKKSADEFQVDQTQIASNVTKELDDWKKNNVQIQERVVREKLQPVFLNKCVTDDYVSMFNQQTSGKASSTGKPSPEVRNKP